ncbi:MBL fold metallo-hydrolase [Verrucomicrobium sp. BvORR034]|uniref:MBL fold metallo-hydrolase n=1 Tax=Verrucomicrobium sp. BvORR034 TaxID=1396418 RepID=UPI000679D236|nr:MBL fold metallo-hydrolase [Verrucomicrobium sp. BvORR034]
MKIHHLNCGILHAPPGPKASCHCLLIEHEGRLVLVDTGIGLEDIKRPLERIGPFAIRAAGFQFHEELTAARQVAGLGFRVGDVTDIVLTHGDHDHVGGLADFPAAKVHVAAEELAQIESGNGRYSAAQFAHGPLWVVHGVSSERWFGLEARRMALVPGCDIYLVPLFGHTLGHCGVAVQVGERWLLHVGDAYYLKVELSMDDHPVSALAAMRAEDDGLRRASLAELRRLVKDNAAEVDLVGYHDFSEFPTGT